MVVLGGVMRAFQSLIRDTGGGGKKEGTLSAVYTLFPLLCMMYICNNYHMIIQLSDIFSTRSASLASSAEPLVGEGGGWGVVTKELQHSPSLPPVRWC